MLQTPVYHAAASAIDSHLGQGLGCRDSCAIAFIFFFFFIAGQTVSADLL